MNSDINKNHARVVLDTNVLISAIGFGGHSRTVLMLTIQRTLQGVTSRVLLAELHEVIAKKFPKLKPQLPLVEQQIKRKFIIVQAGETVSVSRDQDDNRVLEAALEGKCDFIVTGDKDLLDLGQFKGIKIVTPAGFLEEGLT